MKFTPAGKRAVGAGTPFATILALAALAAGVALAWAEAADCPRGQPLPGSGLAPPDTQVLYALPRNVGGYVLLHEVGATSIDSVQATSVLADGLSTYLERVESWYSRGADGDILLRHTLDHRTHESVWYDPPAVLVDFPLETGKSWRIRGHVVRDADRIGGGIVYDQIRSIDRMDTVTAPDGKFPAYFVGETITTGPPLGEMWYSPTQGCVARRDSSAAPWQLRAGAGGTLHETADWLGQPTSLRFAWPTDRTIRVLRTERTVPSDSPADSTRELFTLRAAAEGDGWCVAMGCPGESPDGESPDDPLEVAFRERFNRAGLALVLDASGQFTGARNIGPAREATLDLLAERRHRRDGSSTSATTDSMMRAVIDEAAYEAHLAARWNEMAGIWLACADTTGRVNAFADEKAATLIPGVTLGTSGLAATLRRTRTQGAGGDAPAMVTMALGLDIREPLLGPLVERWLDDISTVPISRDTTLTQVAIRQDAFATLDERTALPQTVQILKHENFEFAAAAGPVWPRRHLVYITYEFTVIDEH
jgi:hypothetical protein